MMKKIKFWWDCAEPAERLYAFAYAVCLAIAGGVAIMTIVEWML